VGDLAATRCNHRQVTRFNHLSTRSHLKHLAHRVYSADH
jgi:hypothetical protein